MPLALYCFDFLSSGILNSINFFPYYIIDFVIMLFPSAKFLDSIQTMIRSKSTEAYSVLTVIILLLSQGLKNLFFFFCKYPLIIFCQSLFQLMVALLMSFLNFFFEDPLPNFPFIPPNINLTFTNRVRTLNFSNISRLFCLHKTKTFNEFLISVLVYSLLISAAFIILYFVFDRKITVCIIEISANMIETTVLFPTFIRIYNNQKTNDIPLFTVLQFLLCDTLQVLLYLYYKAPLSFIIGIIVQLFYDIIFFIIFIVHKSFTQKAEVNKFNNIPIISESNSASSSASLTKSSHSIFQSNLIFEKLNENKINVSDNLQLICSPHGPMQFVHSNKVKFDELNMNNENLDKNSENHNDELAHSSVPT